MKLLWIYEIPNFWLGILVVGAFVVCSILGLWLTRPWVRKHCNAYNDLANSYSAAIGVFYALLVGLIAVATWENHSDVEAMVSNEAVTLSDLYRDVEGYGEPFRGELRAVLRTYVRQVIETEWPQQRQGVEPGSQVGLVTELVRKMATYEPTTPGRQAIHAECLRQLNEFLTYRRERLQAVESGLPAVMWLVVLMGAAITIGMTFFFCVESLGVHGLFTTILSVIIGLVIFLILSLDRPLIGSFSVDASSFEEVLTTVMGEPPAK